MGRLDEAREVIKGLRNMTSVLIPSATHRRDPSRRQGVRGRRLSGSVHPKQSEEDLLQRGPRLGRSIVDQDLQPWKPAKQLGAGLSSGHFTIVMSLEVTVDHQREPVGRRHISSLNVSRLNLFG
jgi:hypothetical protein